MKSIKSQKPKQKQPHKDSAEKPPTPQDSDPYTQKLRAAVIKAGTAMREYLKLHPLKIHPLT
jgi:hypothetical protein